MFGFDTFNVNESERIFKLLGSCCLTCKRCAIGVRAKSFWGYDDPNKIVCGRDMQQYPWNDSRNCYYYEPVNPRETDCLERYKKFR